MFCENDMNRREFVQLLAAGSGLLLVHLGALSSSAEASGPKASGGHRWGFVVDTTKCIGCNSCMRACRAENDVPTGFYRTWVERYQVKADGEIKVDVATNDDHVFGPADQDTERAFFVPKLCNHCENSACTQVCPVGAAYYTKDGVSLVDTKRCVGCGYCVQACPYGSRFINPKTHIADKCTLCYHRITKGELPACVANCPRDARVFGDLNDPNSKISKLLKERQSRVLKAEMGTEPKTRYIGLGPEVV